jgi:hypothetical protein
MLQNTFDEIPREGGSLLREPSAERAALPGLLRVGAVEVDLEKRLQGEPAGGMPTAASRPFAQAADATPSPSASSSRVDTARSATSIARRIMFAFARPCVTTEIPATPSSGADTYGS